MPGRLNHFTYVQICVVAHIGTVARQWYWLSV